MDTLDKSQLMLINVLLGALLVVALGIIVALASYF
jgi:hypothetical protein